MHVIMTNVHENLHKHTYIEQILSIYAHNYDQCTLYMNTLSPHGSLKARAEGSSEPENFFFFFFFRNIMNRIV